MNQHSSLGTPPQSPPDARRGLPRSLALLAVALVCLPLFAAEPDAAAKENARSNPQAEIPWLSGGIGEEAREAMQREAGGYNVQAVFSSRKGNYLAAIPFAVLRPDGGRILSGVSAGPLLYLKLRPGAYQLSAQLDGVWQNKRFQADAAAPPARIAFVANGE